MQRQLRSSKAFSLWALGHPTFDLQITDLVVDGCPKAPEDSLDAPLVFSTDYHLAPSVSDSAVALFQLQKALPEQRLPSPSGTIPSDLPLVVDESKNVSEATDKSRENERAEATEVDPAAAAKKAKRARERLRKKQRIDPSTGREALRRTRFINESLCVAHSDFLIAGTTHSREGYVGLPDQGREWQGDSPANERYAYLREVGGYLEVDTSMNPRVDYPFVDRDGKVWAVVLSDPIDWDKRRAGIRRARERLVTRVASLKEPENRRGDFRSYQHGFSFGNGRIEPMNFVNHPTVQAALEEFYEDSDVIALFRYVENGLRTWFPHHHEDFCAAVKSVQEHHPYLRTPLAGSCFPASTINTGERVFCKPHRDASNEGAAVCLDYIDGTFDINKGGHLVLHEARRIVKLRLGGIIIFPSAVITHENIPIGLDETRFSLTGYLAGGIRRYLAAGGQTLGEWRLRDPVGAAAHDEGGEDRWITGCARFKSPAELVRYWTARSTELS
ncbi:hypothetical protein FRB90_005209 [Tulasnella sp. 427]|nr:hypothetical protein FRB90_005209 [Tulasnella sp. 427]